MEIKTSLIQGDKVIVLDGSPERAEFDPKQLPAEVQDALVAVAVQRVFRERTAGKVDDAEDRKKAAQNIQAQWQAWMNGDLQIERASKVELSEDEKQNAILDFIVARKRAAGDSKPETEIKAAFGKLPKERQNAILEHFKKPLNKFLKERLAAKRKGDKIDW